MKRAPQVVAVHNGAFRRPVRVLLLASRFNAPVTRGLVRGAREALRRAGLSSRQVELVWVPGAYELPVAAARLVRRPPRPDAVIALGALIRGETPQYAVIAQAVAKGLVLAGVRARVPIALGVIVAKTPAQARARARPGAMNRGAEAARAALAMLRLFERTGAT